MSHCKCYLLEFERAGNDTAIFREAGPMSNLPIVAIVGRRNVGKSTLFNAVIKQKKAIVDAVPGLTRDVFRITSITNRSIFTLADTPGLDLPGFVGAVRADTGQRAGVPEEGVGHHPPHGEPGALRLRHGPGGNHPQALGTGHHHRQQDGRRGTPREHDELLRDGLPGHRPDVREDALQPGAPHGQGHWAFSR